MPAPPADILARFGVSARPERLRGGQGTAWRVGDIVLKPLDMSIDALRWQAAVLASVVCDGSGSLLRSALAGRPLRARARGGHLLAARTTVSAPEQLIQAT
jgi:hypothetical protein